MGKLLQKIIILFIILLAPFFFNLKSAFCEVSIAGVKVKPTVNITYSYDDNYRFAEQKESAYTVNVNPSLDLDYSEGITEVKVDVRSPYRYFSESTGEKSKFLETYFNSEITLRLPGRMKLFFEDDFVSTTLSPFLTEERFNRSDRSENRFRGNLYFPIGTMFNFNMDYRNENYRYVDNQNVDNQKTSFNFLLNRNNRKLDNISFRWAIVPVKDTNLFVRYWYQRNIYKNDNLRGSQARQINYGIEQSIGDFLRLSGQIGTGKRKSKVSRTPEDDTLTWATSVFIALTKRLSFFYNVNRTVTDTSYEDVRSENTRRTLSMFMSLRGKLSDNSDIDILASRTNNTSNAEQRTETVFKNITISLENRIFERISSRFAYRYGINEFQGGLFSSSGKRKDKRWSGEGSLTFRITKKTNLSMNYLHEDRSSVFGNFKRNKVSFTLNFNL